MLTLSTIHKLNFTKKNWLFSHLIVRNTHTQKALLETLGKEVITHSRVHTFAFDPEIQSLFHIDSHVSTRLDPQLSHIIRTWKTSLPEDETQLIDVNRRIFSLTSDFYSTFLQIIQQNGQKNYYMHLV